MINELIEKIAAQTGQPVESVAPIVGALLAHLGDVLPAPIAHQVAIMMGLHQEGDAQPDGAAETQPAPGGFLNAALGGLQGGNSGGGFSGATALANVAQSLLSGYFSRR